MDRQYYMITNIKEETATPIVCDGYMIHDSWCIFYEGNQDKVVMGIPPAGFWFIEITKEEFDTAESMY